MWDISPAMSDKAVALRDSAARKHQKLTKNKLFGFYTKNRHLNTKSKYIQIYIEKSVAKMNIK